MWHHIQLINSNTCKGFLKLNLFSVWVRRPHNGGEEQCRLDRRPEVFLNRWFLQRGEATKGHVKKTIFFSRKLYPVLFIESWVKRKRVVGWEFLSFKKCGVSSSRGTIRKNKSYTGTRVLPGLRPKSTRLMFRGPENGGPH